MADVECTDCGKDMVRKMVLRESGEDYLESILRLTEKRGYARVVDIAEDLGVSRASVSIAMKKLLANEYIIHDDKGFLKLTTQGMEIAEKTYSKHKMLTRLLTAIGVDATTAEEEACHIEHHISDRTFELLSAYYEKHFV